MWQWLTSFIRSANLAHGFPVAGRLTGFAG